MLEEAFFDKIKNDKQRYFSILKESDAIASEILKEEQRRVKEGYFLIRNELTTVEKIYNNPN